MHERTIFTHAAVTGVALLALGGCDAGWRETDAGLDASAAPRDIPAGPQEIAPQLAPLFAPPTLLPDLAPMPLREAPRSHDETPMPPFTTPPTHELEAPTDHMPLLDTRTDDGMPRVPATSTDPMPVISTGPATKPD